MATFQVPGWGLVERCGTTEYMNRLIEEDPALQERLQRYEIECQEWIAKTYGDKPRTVILPRVRVVDFNMPTPPPNPRGGRGRPR